MSGRLQHALRFLLRPTCEPHLTSISAFCRIQPPKRWFCKRRLCSFRVPVDDFVFFAFQFRVDLSGLDVFLWCAFNSWAFVAKLWVCYVRSSFRKRFGRGFRRFQTLGVWSHVFDAGRRVRSSVIAYTALVHQVWTSKENGKLFLMLFA